MPFILYNTTQKLRADTALSEQTADTEAVSHGQITITIFIKLIVY